VPVVISVLIRLLARPFKQIEIYGRKPITPEASVQVVLPPAMRTCSHLRNHSCQHCRYDEESPGPDTALKAFHEAPIETFSLQPRRARTGPFEVAMPYSVAQFSDPNFSAVATSVKCFEPCSFSAAPFLGHGFAIIPAPGSFSASAFPVPPSESFGSLPECSRSPWEQYPLRPWVPQGNGAKKEKQTCI
jgi:hypothetical protein